MSERIDYRCLSNRLLQGGISPRRARRIVDELRDHFVDLKSSAIASGKSEAEAGNWAASRLGTEQDVADAMLARPELQSWAARWPWAVYMMLPPLLLVGILYLLVVGTGSALSGVGYLPDPWYPPTVDGILATFEYSIPLVLCGGFCWMVIRRRTTSLWLIPGVVVVGILGGSFHIGTDWGEESWRLGVSLFVYPPYPYPLESTVRICLNVLLALWPYLWWMRRQNGYSPIQPE